MVLLDLVRNDDLVHAGVLWNSCCMRVARWVHVLLNVVMHMVDVLDVLLMIIWAVEVDEAVWNALWWLRLLIMTPMAVGLTRISIEVGHLVTVRRSRFLNGYFIGVRPFGIGQNLVNSSDSLLDLDFLTFFGLPLARQA